MAFDFPSSPTVGQTYAPATGILYTWNGYAWAAQTSSTGMMTKIVPITASGSYVPSPGLVSAMLECVGGGGAGGGVTGNSTFYASGGGGGSGGYSRRSVTAAQLGASQSITIGTGGTPVNNAPGGNGSATSVGSLCVANGGFGGGVNTTFA